MEEELKYEMSEYYIVLCWIGIANVHIMLLDVLDNREMDRNQAWDLLIPGSMLNS